MQLRFLLLIPFRPPRTAPLVTVLTSPGKPAFWQTSSQSPGKELTSSFYRHMVSALHSLCYGETQGPIPSQPPCHPLQAPGEQPHRKQVPYYGCLGTGPIPPPRGGCQSALCHRHLYNPCCLFLFSLQPTLLSDTPEAPSTDCRPAPATGLGAGKAQAEAVHLLAQH